MPIRLDNFTVGRYKYDWDSWTDGSVWSLEPIEEYGVSPESFLSSVRGYAHRHGLRVRTKTEGETVQFRFLGKKFDTKSDGMV